MAAGVACFILSIFILCSFLRGEASPLAAAGVRRHFVKISELFITMHKTYLSRIMDKMAPDRVRPDGFAHLIFSRAFISRFTPYRHRASLFARPWPDARRPTPPPPRLLVVPSASSAVRVAPLEDGNGSASRAAHGPPEGRGLQGFLDLDNRRYATLSAPLRSAGQRRKAKDGSSRCTFYLLLIFLNDQSL